jgi:hypothetical protein
MRYLLGISIACFLINGCMLPSASPPLAQQKQITQIPGRLILQTAEQKQVILKTGELQIFKQNRELVKLSVSQNRFSLIPLTEPGPYTYKGQGIIETLQDQAVPISGSQGGIVPISGSQGGFQPLYKLLADPAANFQAGQQIEFSGELQEDLNQNLPSLDIQVRSENIKLIKIENSIVNTNSEIDNSSQTVIVGNTTGGIQIGPAQEKLNKAPVIESTEVLPSHLVTSLTQAISLKVTAKDPEGEGLQYHWQASRGTLSSDSGTQVMWAASDSQGVATGTVSIDVTIKDAQGMESKTTFQLIVQAEQK